MALLGQSEPIHQIGNEKKEFGNFSWFRITHHEILIQILFLK